MDHDTDFDGNPLSHHEIPPCPLCGKNCRYLGPLASKQYTEWDWEIQCVACGCSVQATGGSSNEAKEKVFVKWSKRSQ